MYKNILFATDLLNEHKHLLEKAVSIAKELHAKLFLLHVIEFPTSIQIAQGLGFTELATPAKEDAQTVLSLLADSYLVPPDQLFVEVGSVKEHIFNKVKELDCQMIIIGNHSTPSFPLSLGSTAHAVINHAPCDVITLKV